MVNLKYDDILKKLSGKGKNGEFKYERVLKSLARHKTGVRPPDEMEYTELQRGESGNKLGLKTNRTRTM